MTTEDLDATERGRILKIIREELSVLRIGRVTTVWTHTSPGDQSNHEVDVAVPPGEPRQEPRRVPIMQVTGGAAYVPREDDLVLVAYLRGRGERPVVLGSVYADADADRAPLATEGDIRRRRGQLYTELAGDGSHARIAKKPGDLDAPTAEVAIDEQGNVSIQTDGDITVSAGGDVVIDEGGDAKAVLTEDAVFDYSGTTSDGASYSGTTSTVSNNETTEAEIE